MPFRNKKNFTVRIQKDIIKDMVKQSDRFERIGTEEIQKAIEFLRVVDTRALKGNSRMRQFSFGGGIVWRFETTDIDYDFIVRNGLGTSTIYGARKYDILGAGRTLKRLNIKSNITTNVGNPRPAKSKS